MPNLVQKLCQALQVPPPFGPDVEPVSKRARTDGQDEVFDFERAVHVFCDAWQPWVQDRVRREQDMSRSTRVLQFVRDSSYRSDPMSIMCGDFIALRVLAVPAVHAMLTPTADRVAACAAINRVFLIELCKLMEKNFCFVMSHLGEVSLYPAAPWEPGASPYYLPEQPDAEWVVVLHEVEADLV